ncbi:glucosamine-6-phosphate deaminase [Salmonella enterica]|nr:glucosamine-6-phosphate deaminase [Salmonella enterica]EBG7476556.1 glucosamine-6-phosphate deaminase [Salmonella enterica]EEN6301684.1 glucosamine-6-phosphate deaminase [Salmonella enterica]
MITFQLSTVSPGLSKVCDDAPRDKCAHFREINGTAAAFQYLKKNYNPTASSFL